MGLIGTALGAFGSIFGGIAASKAARQRKQNIENQQRKNEAWYNRRINEDPTQRASAQAAFSMVQDAIRNRNRQAAATQAVAGGTEEAVAAEKAANNQALAQLGTNIAVNGEARKDTIEGQYLSRDAELQKQLNDIEAQRASDISQAVNGVTTAAGNMDFGDITLKNGKTLSL